MSRSWPQASFAIALAFLVGLVSYAQTASLLADLGKYSFEVASVRPSKGDQGTSFGSPQRGSFHATGVTLGEMIAGAYGGLPGPLPEDKIIGGPKWIHLDRWDVVAKAQENTGGFQAMLKAMQTLLRDRFHLKVHTERRPRPVYNLVLAKKRVRSGSGLRVSKTDCAAAFAKEDETGEWEKDLWCGVRIRRGMPTQLVAKGVTINELTHELERVRGIGRPVVNRTSLKGTFDFEAQYAPMLEAVPPEVEQTWPSLFTAFEEQLGLRLESARGQVEVLVIDSVDLPEEN